ncbi:MAG: putative zinc ribbon protein [Serratia proteamaculans]
MYAKSFMALDGNGRLTGARTAQAAPYDRYTCHLCGSALQYHPEYQTERPWFEHQTAMLTDNGRQHCPYVKPEARALRLAGCLQRVIPGATPVVRRGDWHCICCHNDYHGERYCLTCRTGEHSYVLADADNRIAEVALCAC